MSHTPVHSQTHKDSVIFCVLRSAFLITVCYKNLKTNTKNSFCVPISNNGDIIDVNNFPPLLIPITPSPLLAL